MANEWLIGIDVGTSSVKAILFDGAGGVIDDYRQTYPTTRTGKGYVEQDPDVWVSHINQALTKFAASHDLSRVKGIGITSQVNTHVFVDAEGNALAPAIVWQDGRCGPEAEALDSAVTTEQKLKWWRAPMPIDASHCLSRMKWMHDHQPAIWEKTRWVMLPKDYCILKLTGEAVADPVASIGMVDVDQNYIPELLKLLPGAAERLAPLAKITDIAGTARNELNGVPVAVGTMDAWAGMFGVGVHEAGQNMYLSGTSEILGTVSPTVTGTPGIVTFPPYDGIVFHAGPTQSGGAAIAWFCQMFDIDPPMMSSLVEAIGIEAACPLFLPHLQGERAPLWDITARGTFIGIDATMGRAEMAKAVFEGVAFSARMSLEALEKSSATTAHTMNCGGGGFQSDIWNQIRADIMGVELRRAAVKDPGVTGAAAIAAIAISAFAGFGEALTEIVKYDKTYTPNPSRKAHYDSLYALYGETYIANKTANATLVKINEGLASS